MTEYANALDTLDELHIHAAQAELVTWHGQRALRLENGLALVRDPQLSDATIGVSIGVDGPAYPGIAFHLADVVNYELGYAVPHVSGQWDALQYDPVYHGSNTWQIYHGPSYQRAAEVPTGKWFRFRIDVCGQRAALSVDGQPPLVVEAMVRPEREGRFGLWTYRPAHFCDLTVSPCDPMSVPDSELSAAPIGSVEAWFLEGYGVVHCEANGALNLNRYLSLSSEPVRLSRRFRLPAEDEVSFELGYSDTLSLEVDGQVAFEGTNILQGFADRVARGYVALGTASVQQTLSAGVHHLVAELGVSEGFGWGLALAAHGQGLGWLPAALG
jgi:hypothetical protein